MGASSLENINDTSTRVEQGQAEYVTNEYDVRHATDSLLSEHWVPVQTGKSEPLFLCFSRTSILSQMQLSTV